MRRALVILVLTAASLAAGAPGFAEDAAEPADAKAATLRVTATAYCQGGKTKSGTKARTGIVAADPKVLPVGTVLRIIDGPHSGVYTVMDTGAAIKGHKIDIFIPDCERAEQFGERTLRVRIIRRGWNPKATPSTPEISD